MQGETFEETVQRVGTTIGEIWAEAIATDVFHLVLVWKWGDGALWVLAAEKLVEEDEICEATANLYGRTGEGCKVAL